MIHTRTTTTGPAIRVRGLRRIHGGRGGSRAALGATATRTAGEDPVLALDDIDLDVAAGRLTVVMGPSGAGKSTLLHCLAGLDTATSGSIAYADADMPGGWLEITGMPDGTLTRLRRDRIGFVFPSHHLLPGLTVEQNIVLPLDLSGTRPDRARLGALVDVFGLRGRLLRRPAELSAGEQHRVACARALVAGPAVLFADEPTGELDARASAQLLACLRRAVRELGQTIVLVTHDANAAAHADRVVLLAEGRLVGEVLAPTPATVLEALLDLDADAGPRAADAVDTGADADRVATASAHRLRAVA